MYKVFAGQYSLAYKFIVIFWIFPEIIEKVSIKERESFRRNNELSTEGKTKVLLS